MAKPYFGLPLLEEGSEETTEMVLEIGYGPRMLLAPLKMECHLGFWSENNYQASYLQGTMQDFFFNVIHGPYLQTT